MASVSDLAGGIAQLIRRHNFRRGCLVRGGRCPSHRPELGAGAHMTVVDGILLAVSVAVFVYLGVAMFKPEWF